MRYTFRKVVSPLAAKYASRLNLKPWQRIPSDKTQTDRFHQLKEGIQRTFETCGNKILVKVEDDAIHVLRASRNKHMLGVMS